MAERGIIFKDDFVSTPGKSWFDMSFDYLFSMNFGELVPSTCMECMGGDVIHAKSDSFVRLAPLVAPVFGKANMFSYHFYVRNFSIWKNWRSFYAEGDQRESWQQSLTGSFVPPEMPYLRVHRVLHQLSNYDFQVYGDEAHSESFNNGLDIDFGVGTITSSLSRCGAVMFISNGSSTVPTVKFIVDIHSAADEDFNIDSEAIVIPFIYNKYEAGAKIPQFVHNYPNADYYNIFSPGTLFDYLGVDLSGHYSKQEEWLRNGISRARTVINDTDPDIDLDVIFGQFSDYYDVEFNLSDFLKKHYILGFCYKHNDQFCSCTTFGKHSFNGGDEDYKSDWLADTDIVSLCDMDAKISTLPLRAYHSIYIDYFRDENYISVNPCIDFARDGDDIDVNQGWDNLFNYLTLCYKCYEHDPYTTALPQAQRGAPVRFLTDANLKTSDDTTTVASGGKYQSLQQLNGFISVSQYQATASQSITGNTVIVDLSAATIENFRFANATQKLLEKIARSGNRYYEYMRAIYNVIVDDAKIDRPIYLGGDKSPIQISEVLQTSASDVTTDQPLGQMAGRGVSVVNDEFIEYITPDAGFFIEICCALPRTNYQQGLAPMFHRFDRLDFSIPDYAQLGEQQVPQRELWYSANESDDEKPFGFQSRYYDMKYQRDRTSGSFKDSLSFWTWSRIFDEAPIAGQEFLEVRPDYRQFAVTDKNTEHIYVHMWHDIQVNRCLPVFGTPKL